MLLIIEFVIYLEFDYDETSNQTFDLSVTPINYEFIYVRLKLQNMLGISDTSEVYELKYKKPTSVQITSKNSGN